MASCPSGFQVNPTQGTTCVVECPAQKGFDIGVVESMPACVYRDDKSIFVKLTAVPGTLEATIEKLKTTNVNLYNKYVQAQSDFDTKFPVQASKVDKNKQITDAFNELQAAENVRDQSPQAYQDARMRYYTLTKGDGWLDEEKERIKESEVAPRVTQYVSSYKDITARLSQQKQTQEIMTAVRDKVAGMRDDFKYTIDTFNKQVDTLRNQINIEKKQREKDNKYWIDLILNLLIVILGLFTVVVLARKLFAKPKSVYAQGARYG